MQQELAPTRQLSIDADDALCHRWRDHHDILAAQLLVERYRHLVVDIAVIHHARHQPSEALLGEGYVGLMRAICRFDPDSGIHFSTYAISWISAAVRDRLLDQMQAVRDHVGQDRERGRPIS
jgi:RNA polymerase sigma-32 factor